ncbi:glycosyltransferase family 2 protein [Pontibacter ramchanderi]|uniref:Glycosyl transferase family 2 n=1 Tax=Pontibacter ramchanderi TaxID=1179743 RepID=A0A2N3U7T3_9BACT|nr:glycosyltransferase [Pontibacter ramchanderi]PKV62785.1 glycosyl transferase family 2 [Pontibacter ramchanderi]
MPLVTVLMPVYNSEKYLATAINSILNQTLHDFEFLIIDDGSTDKSIEIVKQYDDSRIRFYENTDNLGITNTLNRGIELASTQYIARMDADDISYPERLKLQFEYLKENPACALVSSHVEVISENSLLVHEERYNAKYFYYNLIFFSGICHPSVMYRKHAVQNVKGYTAAYAEDFELFWQLSRKYEMHNINQVLLKYRLSEQSLHQKTKKLEYEQAHLEQMMRNIRYYTSNDYTIPTSYLECYRNNYTPLLNDFTLSNLISCIEELDFITRCVIKKESSKHSILDIQNAASCKRKQIIAFFSQHLTLSERTKLLFHTKSPKQVLKHVLLGN